MKALFCTDGSETSYNAIYNFSKWVKDFTADIICVADWSFLPETISVEDSEFITKCTNTADSVLKKTETLLKTYGINVEETIKMCGIVTDSIMEAYEDKQYDFIIMGSSGKRGIQKWLGSVSQEISLNAPVSTYVSKNINPAENILFAIDSTDSSKKITDFSIENLKLKDKKIHIATVYETPEYLFFEGKLNDEWIKDVNTKQEEASAILLDRLENKFKENDIKIYQKAVLRGNPAAKIIDFCNDTSIDLVVCGTRNRKTMSKILLNSVSQRILENVRSDVLIIRP